MSGRTELEAIPFDIDVDILSRHLAPKRRVETESAQQGADKPLYMDTRRIALHYKELRLQNE